MPDASAKTRHAAAQSASTSAGAFPQNDKPTIISALAANPTLAPSIAAKQLFPLPSAAKRGILRFRIKEQLEEGRGKHWHWNKGATHANNAEPDDEELEATRIRYGYKTAAEGGPRRLYLMMLSDALLPLPRNPMSGVVSPPLLATSGIVPLSIFSTGPDIIGHYYDCIVAARREVVLLTNYWQGGKNVDRIADALRELNARVETRRRQRASKAKKEGTTLKANGSAANGTAHPEQAATENNERLHSQGAPGAVSGANTKGVDENADEEDVGAPEEDEKIVVKLMWDRGPQTLADLFRLRKPVPPSMWKSNGLPTEQEIPNLSVEILNYHRPLMGTFHAKLLLVDRQVALINSNNIQDRPNVEACVRLEGDIVNSVYDHFLISWGNPLQPPTPCLSLPAPVEPSAAAFTTGEESTLPSLTASKMIEAGRRARERLLEEDFQTEDEKERSALSPLHRLHFADVVEAVMGGSASESHHGQKEQHASAAASVDKEKAARKAGALWAEKMLGDRRFNARSGEGQEDASGTRTPPESPTRGRHFAEMVEAVMKKEGIKPGGWAEGALDVFGMGQSSSKNVAEQVRKSRTARPSRDAQARGLSIPQAVNEESAVQSSAPQTPAFSPVGDDAADAKSGDALRADQVQLNVTAPTSEDAGQAKANGSIPVAEAKADTESAPLALEVHPVDPEAEHQSKARPELAPIKTSASASSGLTVPGAEHSRLKGSAKQGISVDDDAVSASSSDNGSPKGQAAELNAGGENKDGAPGSVAYRRLHQRTMSNLSRTSAAEKLGQITKSLDFANNSKVKGEITPEQLAKVAQGVAAAANDGDLLDFQPYVFHKPHKPVPMALVNRRPHGTPGHSDIRNPQDAAWLAGFRYAKKHVFIQSPTLNASPIKAAVLACVRRHVRVELWLDLGFNDKSESMPFQGGTNEQVVTGMYRQLRREGKGDEKFLDVYWYTGKDMTRPLNAVRKQRNCHVKFASFDGEVAILGSGNQDTQSWFHSQEINVMVDSTQIVDEWLQALRRNQSTHLYGKVDQRDGIWRGKSGAEIADTGKEA